MKKLLCVILCLTLSFLNVGCNNITPTENVEIPATYAADLKGVDGEEIIGFFTSYHGEVLNYYVGPYLNGEEYPEYTAKLTVTLTLWGEKYVSTKDDVKVFGEEKKNVFVKTKKSWGVIGDGERFKCVIPEYGWGIGFAEVVLVVDLYGNNPEKAGSHVITREVYYDVGEDTAKGLKTFTARKECAVPMKSYEKYVEDEDNFSLYEKGVHVSVIDYDNVYGKKPGDKGFLEDCVYYVLVVHSPSGFIDEDSSNGLLWGLGLGERRRDERFVHEISYEIIGDVGETRKTVLCNLRRNTTEKVFDVAMINEAYIIPMQPMELSSEDFIGESGRIRFYVTFYHVNGKRYRQTRFCDLSYERDPDGRIILGKE